jgi:hypothetical protein
MGASADSKLRAGWALAAVTLAVGLSACGEVDQTAVVARVGDVAITSATAEHWANVVRRGGAFSGFRGEREGGTPRQRALILLITSNWLIGEAERQGLPVTGRALDIALAERMKVGGGAEFQRMLEHTGQTIGGVKFEIRSEMALEAIRRALARRAEHVTRSDVERFYHSHAKQFSYRETRVVDIIQNLPSAAAAAALVKRVGTGRRFAQLAIHKGIAYTPGLLAGEEDKKVVDNAIFAASVGAVSQPMRLYGAWAVFVVRRINSPRLKPLASVRAAVVDGLVEQRKRDVSSTFAGEYAKRWVGATSCEHGYVVSGCSQYRGSLGAYEDPFSVP